MITTAWIFVRKRQFWISLIWVILFALCSLAINLCTYSFERGIKLNTIVLNVFLAFLIYQLLNLNKPLWMQLVLRSALSIFIVMAGAMLIFIGGYRVIFEHNIPVGVLLQTIQTNSAEAKEALEQFVTLKAIIWSLFVLICIAMLLVFTWLVKASKVLTHKLISLLLILSVCVVWGVYSHRFKPFAFTFYTVQFKDFIEQSQAFSHQFDNIKNRYQELDLTQHPNWKNHKQIYVVVVGESLTRCRMGVYGYERDTTPYLSQHANQYVRLENVISPAMYTEASLKHVLTKSNVEKPLSFFDANNFTWVEMARRAGLKTSWISNQRAALTGADSTASGNAKLADISIFTNNNLDTAAIAAHDEVVLPQLKKQMETALLDDDSHLIVIHIYGNHGRYEHRYPEAFAHFANNEIPPHFDESDRPFLEYINQYDNATRYNDWLIGQITSMLFDSSAGSNNKGLIRGFMYFSDHGEDPSRPRNLLNQAVLEQIVGVPLVLRLEGGRDQQQWMQQINTKQNTPFMTDNLVYLLADMMGLQGKSLDQTRNLASTQYQIKDRYTIHQDLNFDGNSRGCWVRGF